MKSYTTAQNMRARNSREATHPALDRIQILAC